MSLPVTYLFVPGDRPDRFDKALASPSDAIIVDLEDAVAPDGKENARDIVGQWVDSHPALRDRVLVRINDASTRWFDGDLVRLRRSRVRVALLPKAESADQVAIVRNALDADGAVIPMIETARGIANLDDIASASGVQRLAFGSIDYTVDLDLSGDERGLLYPASRMAVASRCAGLASPVAGVTTDLDDETRLLADVAWARALGFGAKLCIHPRQIAIVQRAFAPTDADIDWATRVLAAASSGAGAVQVDGRMVDRPVVDRARAILQRARRASP